MDEESLKALEGRIKQLEDELRQLRGARQQAADITPEEMKAYTKVRDLIATDPDLGCGINECSRCIVLRCITSCVTNCIVQCITRCIVVCDVECICGPCNIGGLGRAGLSRFGGLGDD